MDLRDEAVGRARDADVIMGDNASIFRLVGLNGVSIGAFLTFSYDAAGTAKIIVRAFDLLDYTVPESPSDIGDLDNLYGEAGDDTLHGQVGKDLLFGNGNDDNLYGGQGDDNIFGGGGDDAISHSDELKPPPPAENRTARGPQNRIYPPGGPGATLVHVSANAPAALFATPAFVKAVYLTDLYLGFSNTSAWIEENAGAVFPEGGSSWRIFASGIFPTNRFGPQPVGDTDVPAGDGFNALLNERADVPTPPTEVPPTPTLPPDEPASPEPDGEPRANPPASPAEPDAVPDAPPEPPAESPGAPQE